MQSGYHSLLPAVDGVMQAPGKTFSPRKVSYVASEDSARLSLDIAAAYPPESKIQHWQRTVSLRRGKGIEIKDAYELTGAANEIVLGLLTPCKVDLAQGRITLTTGAMAGDRISGQGQVTYDAKTFAVSVETIPIEDARLGGVWGARLNRIVFTAKNPLQKGTWTFWIRP
jgi:hypothetical protein